ncbi:helicase associated domain-containing protein [Streptomyces sp. NPDC056983]|uniref:helicase associated domain-containing protein n=1 Tax=Streptomyces sp. NPDC056983 TaxID=3345987 RepID=UPI00362C53A2
MVRSTELSVLSASLSAPRYSVSFNVIDTERQDWARGWAALKKFTEREAHARVPYDHKEGAHPLGQRMAEQRRT